MSTKYDNLYEVNLYMSSRTPFISGKSAKSLLIHLNPVLRCALKVVEVEGAPDRGSKRLQYKVCGKEVPFLQSTRRVRTDDGLLM